MWFQEENVKLSKPTVERKVMSYALTVTEPLDDFSPIL